MDLKKQKSLLCFWLLVLLAGPVWGEEQQLVVDVLTRTGLSWDGRALPP
jgi:hypothetical protein